MIWSTLACWRSLSGSTSSSWPKPRIAFRGVRSSWLTRDRNSVLARVARSASSRCDSSCCARFSSVISEEIPHTAYTSPA